MSVAELFRVGRIERRFESIRVRLRQLDFMNVVVERGQHNLGGERQRRRYGQRGAGGEGGDVRRNGDRGEYLRHGAWAGGGLKFDVEALTAVTCFKSLHPGAVAKW